MPVRLPGDEDVLLTPPDEAEAALLLRGIVTAAAPPEGLTDLQALIVGAVFDSMTGHSVDPTRAEPIAAHEFAQGLARRNLAFRTRIVQMTLLPALVLQPLPPEVSQRIRAFADELGVRDDVIGIAEKYASGSLDLAAADFARNGYLASVDPARLRAVHATALRQSWAQVADNPALHSRWRQLESLPAGTLGRGVADFYRDRGFVYPGAAGSAPPLLAQHDWVHVLAGYGTSLESELEVFGFIARANDDPQAFSLLAMVVCLFETGSLAAGAGLFEADPGHLGTTGMATRLADALRRGALVNGSQDFLGLDWFSIADRPIAVVRQEIGVTAKSANALAAGSAGPWQRGGITPFQLRSAQQQARVEGRDYLPWHPDPART